MMKQHAQIRRTGPEAEFNPWEKQRPGDEPDVVEEDDPIEAAPVYAAESESVGLTGPDVARNSSRPFGSKPVTSNVKRCRPRNEAMIWSKELPRARGPGGMCSTATTSPRHRG